MVLPLVQDVGFVPLTSLKGVGPQMALRLQKLGINWVEDLIFHLPLRYQDRSRVYRISELLPGQQVVVEGVIGHCEVVNRRRRSLLCRLDDGSGSLQLRFFHFTSKQLARLQAGNRLRCFGEVRSGFQTFEMVHPELDFNGQLNVGKDPAEPHLTPVYPLTDGIQQRLIRRWVEQALQWYHSGQLFCEELLPASLLQQFGLPSLAETLTYLHHPRVAPDSADGSEDQSCPYRRRLALEELLAHHFALRQATSDRHVRAKPCQAKAVSLEEFRRRLGFELTTAQQRVVSEISTDLMAKLPMLRLVQGDVGSGKTAVAAIAAFIAIQSGYQVAMMAPTELLAEQHYANFCRWFEGLDTEIVWLAGNSRNKQRRETLEKLQSGRAAMVLGTHAVFQQSVEFDRLALVIIDEQHRFGVNQRLSLRDKGIDGDFLPHQLIMTATPIPRTLAMLQFSELAISVIDELPPGRTPVVTTVVPVSKRDAIIERIQDWVALGRQAYWVCTLVEESEVLQCQAAEEAALLLTDALPGIKTGLVHGRMKSAEKDTVMQAFKRAELDVLVATTVIEVGVDVPNAGLMVIENAERLGLSQLHQLRGRVGRGPGDSYCVLLYQPPLSETAHSRLGILRETNDGFLIAEKDLELRGPGEVLGTRQTGQMQFRIADLSRDEALLPEVHRMAEHIEKDNPEKVKLLIQRWLGTSTRYIDV